MLDYFMLVFWGLWDQAILWWAGDAFATEWMLPFLIILGWCKSWSRKEGSRRWAWLMVYKLILLEQTPWGQRSVSLSLWGMERHAVVWMGDLPLSCSVRLESRTLGSGPGRNAQVGVDLGQKLQMTLSTPFPLHCLMLRMLLRAAIWDWGC